MKKLSVIVLLVISPALSAQQIHTAEDLIRGIESMQWISDANKSGDADSLAPETRQRGYITMSWLGGVMQTMTYFKQACLPSGYTYMDAGALIYDPLYKYEWAWERPAIDFAVGALAKEYPCRGES